MEESSLCCERRTFTNVLLQIFQARIQQLLFLWRDLTYLMDLFHAIWSQLHLRGKEMDALVLV